MKKTDLAWLAGIIDGEGCIQVEKRGQLWIQIGMTHLPTMQRIHYLFGGSLRNHSEQDSKWKPRFLWVAIALLGVAYKPSSPITDDSLGRSIIQQASMLGAPTARRPWAASVWSGEEPTADNEHNAYYVLANLIDDLFPTP